MIRKRMRGILCGVILAVAAVGSFYVQDKETVMDEMVWENIEALAENETGNYACAESGDIDCHGHKVLYKLENFSLE